jgi:hypothetical protein
MVVQKYIGILKKSVKVVFPAQTHEVVTRQTQVDNGSE